MTDVGLAKRSWLTILQGVCNTQICGPNPDPWNKVYNAFERTLYENIQ